MTHEQKASKMVEEQLIPRGIRSESVLEALRNVPRHFFVPEHLRDYAYDDSPLPVAAGQIISQPYIVAYMTEQLAHTPGMKILEIGTGSGYQAAILAELKCEVCTIERIEELASSAKKTLTDLKYDNVKVIHGDGYQGWPSEAPFDAIIVTAAPRYIPKKLVEQIKNSGKMVIPVGESRSVQFLKIVIKEDGIITSQDLLPVRFVPMVEWE